MEIDVAVIGGGPAGLKAAIEIARRGGKVAVVDENHVPGGKLLGQLHEEPSGHGWWNGREIAERMTAEAKAAGVILLNGVQVWGLEPGWKVHLSDTLNRPMPSQILLAKAVLLATGAVEKPLAVNGWTLPGVMTIGAAQVLTNLYKVKPGQNVLIAGLDVLSLSIARAMVISGVNVKGIVLPAPSQLNEEQSDLGRAFARLFAMSHLAPNAMLRLGGSLFKPAWMQSLAVRFFPARGISVGGIPLLLRKALMGIEGSGRAETARLATLDASGKVIDGSESTVSVDAVCLSGGLTPLSELAAVAGCKFARMEGLGGAVPVHNDFLETTADRLFVAGNITGIEGAKVAMAQGELAGISICAKLAIGLVHLSELEAVIEKVNTVRRTAEFPFHPDIGKARDRMKILSQNA